MEFIQGGDFFHHLVVGVWVACHPFTTHQTSGGRFSEDWSRFYTAEICLGLWFLHGNGILYRCAHRVGCG